MPLTHKDLKKHIWLVEELRHAQPSEELEASGFNYFTRDYAGNPLALKAIMLR